VSSVAAPRTHLTKATPSGVKKSSPSFIKMNEQPQTMPRAR
jgi:hypothetical protein